MHDRSKKYTGWKILMDTHRKKIQQALHDVEIDTKNRYQKILGGYSLSGEYTPFLKNFLGINSWNSFAGWAKRYL
jgi:hypothetical protein